MNIALCFCVRNCGKHLPRIFQNIESVKKLDGINVYAVFVYDNCTDNSAALLNDYKQKTTNATVVKSIDNRHPARTVRIAKARNTCLDLVYNELKDIKYHIMIDADNICITPWNTQLLSNYLHNVDNDNWDCLSFNRDNYYDIWALLFDDFKHHCWGFGKDGRIVVNTMRNIIIQKLKTSKTNTIEVLSAFNGFCIYNTERFKGFVYNGTIEKVYPLFTDKERDQTEVALKKYKSVKCQKNSSVNGTHGCIKAEECCEHIYYHVTAHQAGRKIKISKHKIM
jgi:hypothetical protein